MRYMKNSLIVILLALTLCGCGLSKDTKSDTAVANSAIESDLKVEESVEEQEIDTVVEQGKKEEIDNSLIENYNIFTVTSENLNDGKWDDVISYTNKGENLSPQLSWEPVEGATTYVIYMVDTSMQYWIHWKLEGVTDTNLPLGYAKETEYIGPYPPSGGKHTYEVYVIALKNSVERVKGGLNSQNQKFTYFIDALDIDTEGNTGNIAGAAHIVGTFTN